MPPRKLNIAFLLGSANSNGGIARVTSMLSDSLNNTGSYEITIVGYCPSDQEGYGWNTELSYAYLLKKNKPMKWGIFKACVKLRNILKDQKIDVLICCSSLFGPLGVLATRFNRTRLIYWDHSSFFENTAHDFAGTGKIVAARYADAVVSLTKYDTAKYGERTKAKHIEQIYNPIDSALENLKHEYDVGSKKIISVGRLTYLKNFELLADVAQIVLNKHPEWKWHIYGAGESEESIRNKIKTNNLEERLILKGHSSNLYEIYKEYAIMVMTSRSEGFPMTLLEGMANKLPLVSFDIRSGPDEIIREGENGFLIEPLNVEDMASKINLLIENNETRKTFSENNKLYIENYNLKSITDRWDYLINQISHRS